MWTLSKLYIFITLVPLMAFAVPLQSTTHVLLEPAPKLKVAKNAFGVKLSIAPSRAEHTLETSLAPATPPKNDIAPSHLSVDSAAGLINTEKELRSETLVSNKPLVPTKISMHEVGLHSPLENDVGIEDAVSRQREAELKIRDQVMKTETPPSLDHQLRGQSKIVDEKQAGRLDSNQREEKKVLSNSWLKNLSEWYSTSVSLLARFFRGVERYFHPRKIQQARARMAKEAAEQAARSKAALAKKAANNGTPRNKGQVSTDENVITPEDKGSGIMDGKRPFPHMRFSLFSQR